MTFDTSPKSPMKQPKINPQSNWDEATFAGAVEMRDRHAQNMSLAERFQWLDEMYQLCHYQAKLRGAPSPSLRFDRNASRKD